MLPVGAKVCVDGSYSSALERVVASLMTPPILPPVIKTFPLFKSVAVGDMRAAPRLLAGALPVGANPTMPKQLDVAFAPPGAVARSVYPLPGQPAELAP